MTTLSKIAVLVSKDCNLTFELEEIQAAFKKIGVETKFFEESDSIIAYKPDCVLITSPQDGKLTQFPTYGLINKPRDQYLELPRFLRNILTYDGYLTFSPRLKQMLGDVMFGARKLDTGIFKADFFPAATEFSNTLVGIDKAKILIFEPDFSGSKFITAIHYLLEMVDNAFLLTFSNPKGEDKFGNKFIVAHNTEEVTAIIKQNGIVVCLESADQQEKFFNTSLIKAISCSAVTITQHTEVTEKYFADNLYYLPSTANIAELPAMILNHVQEIIKNPDVVLEKTRQAHQVFLAVFAFDALAFTKFHETALIKKGYVPNPDPEIEKKLPSVSYIMRTGGKHRPFLERTLDCLVAQQYPDLRVVFVIHAPVPYMHEIIAQYPTLKFKVIESLKSRRSEAIRDGMAGIETELFGLFDDDDEIFPNHVRSLVKAMQYNSNRDWRGKIGMAYSGSLHVDDTYPVYERVEFHDHKLKHKEEKRAIEHFKFYSSVLMSQHSWFMPNGWLARKELIDEELLVDPELDTCEDLYFELQLAQKTHFAFSVEVTAIHHFHHLGNSTIDDNYKHLPDTQRIAMRNFGRAFPPDALYDTQYNMIGKFSCYDPNQIAYQDRRVPEPSKEYYENAFYPFRETQKKLLEPIGAYHFKLKHLVTLPYKGVKFLYKYSRMEQYRREYYQSKFKLHFQQRGFFSAIKKMASFMAERNPGIEHVAQITEKRITMVDRYYKFKIMMRYAGFRGFVKSVFGKLG